MRKTVLGFAIGIVSLILVNCATGVPEPELAEVYFKLGNAYFDLGQYDNAVNAFTRALQYDDSLVRAGYNLAHVYLETGRRGDALTILRNLLEKDPGNTILLSTLGWAYYLGGEPEKALQIYQQVSEKLPGDKDALFNTATLLWHLDRYEEALRQFLELNELEPSQDNIAAIAELYAQTGDLESAISYLELFVQADDGAVAERLTLARLYGEVRDFGKAVAMYGEAIERMESPDPKALFDRGSILLIYIEDYDLGMTDMRAAFDAGFADTEAIKKLADELPVDIRAAFTELLGKYGLMTEATGDKPSSPVSQGESLP